MLNRVSGFTSYVLIAGFIATLSITVYVLQRDEPQLVPTQAASATFVGGWTMDYTIVNDGLSYYIRDVDGTGSPSLCAPTLGQAPRVETWWHAKLSNEGREYFEVVGGRDSLGIMHSGNCRETTLDTIQMKEDWTKACVDGEAAEVTLGIDVETSPRHGPKVNLAEFGCPNGSPTATPTVTPTPTLTPTPTPGVRACQKSEDIPLQDCQKPEVDKQPSNVKLAYNNDFTFTVTWDAATNLPSSVRLQEYRVAIVNDSDDRAWIGYPQKISVDQDTTTYTSPSLPEDLRGDVFYARVRAIYNDQLAEGEDCVCRSNYSESSKVTASAGCQNCVGGTQIRYPGQWDDNGDGSINNCNEACKAYWGPSCNGNNYCSSPGSSDSAACCACQTSNSASCNQITPDPTITLTPAPATPTPGQGGPGPGYQPGVCKGEACYSPAKPQVSVHKNLNIGGVNFVFSEQGQPASNYSLRWAPADKFDSGNHTDQECCDFSQCTGEQSCGSREACTGNESSERSFNPICDGNQCVFERGGLSPCVEYKAEIITQVNTATCPNKPQAVSNEMSFLYSDGSCDDREHGLGGGSGPAPQPSPEGTPAPTSPPGDRPGRGYCPLGTGTCSPENLREIILRVRPDINITQALLNEASQLCQRESSSCTNPINDQCLPKSLRTHNRNSNVSKDYSVGCFQINLLGRCPGGISYTEYLRNWPGTGEPFYCEVQDRALLGACEDNYLNVENNIRKMLELSNDGTNWFAGRWGGACACGLADCVAEALESAANVNADGYIDAADVAVVMAAYGTSQGEADYSQLADFCGPAGEGADGNINAYEISCLIRDWNPRQ